MSAKIILDYSALKYFWEQLSEEQKIEFTQSVASTFSRRYLKDYANDKLNLIKDEIINQIKQNYEKLLRKTIKEVYGVTSSAYDWQILPKLKDKIGEQIRLEVSQQVSDFILKYVEERINIGISEIDLDGLVNKEVERQIRAKIAREVENNL